MLLVRQITIYSVVMIFPNEPLYEKSSFKIKYRNGNYMEYELKYNLLLYGLNRMFRKKYKIVHMKMVVTYASM